MLYVMMIVWCFFIYVTGRGLYGLWTSVAGGALVDWLMLPATLLSELLYSAGRLVTGRPVFAGLIAPQDASADPCKVAISGKNGFWVEMLSVFLAMAGAWMAMLILCRELSGYVIESVNNWDAFIFYSSLPKTFPNSWGDVWNQLQYFCKLTQRTGDVLANQNYTTWQMPAFLYGSIVLAVKLGPVRHDLRAMVAVLIALVGVVAFVGSVSTDFAKFVDRDLWFVLTYIFGLLLLLLFATLVVGGIVKLCVIFFNNGHSRSAGSGN